MFSQSIQNQISLLGGNQNNSQPATTITAAAPEILTVGDGKEYHYIKPTKIYNRDGWTAQSYIHANGYDWSIYTTKGYNGKVYTSVTTCKVNNDDGMFTSIDMGMMMGKPVNQDFKITCPIVTGRVTDKLISEVHKLAIIEFLRRLQDGQLPHAPKAIQVGQVIFTHHPNGRDDKRVVYAIDGDIYKTVSLDGSRTHRDSHIRPYSEKFGIGVYYNEGDTITQEEIDRLLPIAYANMEAEAEREQEQLLRAAKKAEEKKAYLAQFQKADKRTTTTMLKAYILREFPTVSKVSITSDSFSGGDSIDITYYAPEPIKELESIQYQLRYGSFDGMTDSYSHTQDKEAFIIDGFIMEEYKYAHVRFEQSNEVRATKPQPTTTTMPATNNGVSVTLMSEKGGIEIKFASKPNSDILDKLKSLGFRWSRFNSVWWANQSSERKAYAMQLGGITEDTRQDEAGAMVQANDDAYFDNFCQRNNI